MTKNRFSKLILSISLLTSFNIFTMEQPEEKQEANQNGQINPNVIWMHGLPYFIATNDLSCFAHKNLEEIKKLGAKSDKIPDLNKINSVIRIIRDKNGHTYELVYGLAPLNDYEFVPKQNSKGGANPKPLIEDLD